MDDIVAIIVCYFVFGALGNVLRAFLPLPSEFPQ